VIAGTLWVFVDIPILSKGGRSSATGPRLGPYRHGNPHRMRTSAMSFNTQLRRRRRVARLLLWAPKVLLRSVLGAVISLTVLVALVAALSAAGVLHADRLTKFAIKTLGPDLTGTRVAVARVDIKADPDRLRASVTGLRIGNPKGYRKDDALRIGRISIDANPERLAAKPAVIRRIVIDRLKITYEFGFDGSNIETIERNITTKVQRRWGNRTGAIGLVNPRFIVRDLIIRKVHVALRPKLLLGATLATPLPDIRLRNIGRRTGGATIGEIAEVVMDALTDAAAGIDAP
jgi:hypothetical protein